MAKRKGMCVAGVALPTAAKVPTFDAVHATWQMLFICIILSIHIWEMAPFSCTTNTSIRSVLIISRYTRRERDKMHDQNLALIPIICTVCGCHTETMDENWNYGMVINQSDLFSLHRIKKRWIFIGWILKVHLMYTAREFFSFSHSFVTTFCSFGKKIPMNTHSH